MHIVIVGGGTAGWISALTLIKTQSKHHKITLVESKKIGIIGAGEGSTKLLHNFLNNVWFDTGINFEEFVKFCNVTPKIGIKHINWTGDGSEYFAPLDGSKTSGMSPDVDFCKTLIEYPAKFHIASHLGRCYENKQISDGSYHFDAFKISEFLSKICVESGVNHIDKEVWAVKTDENNFIKSIICTDETEITGDFFIDCTGFNRCLCGALDMKWISYKKYLPVDSAISFQKPLTKDWEPVTIARAMKYGWVWEIPTSERYGCGYVYSSKYTSDYDALEELKSVYGEIDILRHFKFESGRSEVMWKNNCLAMGLSSAFLEPLEATSIHSTIMQIMTFVMEYLSNDIKTTVVQDRINTYNLNMNKMYDDFRDFLILHYMGGRSDSKFWEYISEGNTITPKVKYILDICKHRVPSSLTIEHYFGCAGIMLYNWVLAGIKKIDSLTAKKTLNYFDSFNN